jgi:hypothetical protein
MRVEFVVVLLKYFAIQLFGALEVAGAQSGFRLSQGFLVICQGADRAQDYERTY